MQILRTGLISFSLLFLTVLAIMLINTQFVLLLEYLLGVQFYPGWLNWQFYLFIIAISGALCWAGLSRWFVLHFMKIRDLKNFSYRSYVRLNDRLNRLAASKKMVSPGLVVYDSVDINAFTTGFSQSSAMIVVSTGLLDNLNPDEQEAVLAHELTHVINHDMLMLSLMQGVINVLVMMPCHSIGWLIDRQLFSMRHARGPAYYTSWVILQVCMGLLATIWVMWFSRWREFRADKGAARMVGNGKMQQALSCLQAGHYFGGLPEELGSLGISGQIGHGIKYLFATHPSLKDRIAALKDDWH